MRIRSVKQQALKDISKELDGLSYLWNVTPKSLNNEETSRLNNELGIHKVNKSKN